MGLSPRESYKRDGARVVCSPYVPHKDGFYSRAKRSNRGGSRPQAIRAGAEGGYFFWTYLRQSSVTAVRMMMPENTNCRLVSMPRMVRE